MVLLKCEKLVQRFEHVVKKHNHSGIIGRLLFQIWPVHDFEFSKAGKLSQFDDELIKNIFDQMLMMERLEERRYQMDLYKKSINAFTDEDYDMMATFDTPEELFGFVTDRIVADGIRLAEIEQMQIDAEPLNQFTPEDLDKLDTLETADELFNFFFDRLEAEAERFTKEAIRFYKESLSQLTPEDYDTRGTFDTPEALFDFLTNKMMVDNALPFLGRQSYNPFTDEDYDMMDTFDTPDELFIFITDRIHADAIRFAEDLALIMEELAELCSGEVVANMRIVSMHEKMVVWLYNMSNEGYELETKIDFDAITDFFIELYWPFKYYNDFVYQTYESLIIQEYFTILIYLFLAILLSYLILGFSYLFVVQNPETEKMSAYECGFEPYEDARQKFDVKFYIIAMLFIIFDLETMYLIPWCSALPYINSVGYFSMMEFIFELSVSFLYIWCIGGLDWD